MNLISLDWFSGSGVLTEPLLPGNYSGFTLKELKLSTKVFAKWFQLYHGITLVADILTTPKTPIIKPDSVHWKLSNEYLYRYAFTASDYSPLSVLPLISLKPTRADFCCDFNLFSNGLLPEKFITRVVRGIYLRKHGGRFKVEGTQSVSPLFHYLRYGSTSSPVSVYLYNKSKEMKEVKFKPWIFSKWKKFGLNTDIDVWRLEFSVKESRMNFVDKTTGQTVSLSSILPYFYDDHEIVFKSCLKKYGTFCVNNYRSNITRMKPIELLGIDAKGTAIYLGEPIKSHSNFQKFTIKQLVMLENDLRLSNRLRSLHIRDTIIDFEAAHALVGYHNKVNDELVNK